MKQTNPDSAASPDPSESSEAPASPEPSVSQPKPPPPADETIKETFESIIIAFILAFVFRAYVVEAFVIPTGSMAPTLLGAHYTVECEQCGYEFKVNFSADSHPPQRNTSGQIVRKARWEHGVACPMCNYNIDMTNPKTNFYRYGPGDRILVHKYIYQVSEPRRWDVVVFKAPQDPNTNYIKRLIGLPNESIRLLDGNVYYQKEGEELWHIARKGDSPKVQRAVWQPIYHSQYIPRDHGELQGPGERNANHRWEVPWVATNGQWELENRRSYAFAGGEGTIAFDFDRGGNASLASIYAYNQLDSSMYSDQIEDIRIAAALDSENGDTSIQFTTETRLTGPTQTVIAKVDPDGTITLSTIDPLTNTLVKLMEPQKTRPLDGSGATTIEFWSVDQELSVWINGRRELRYVYDSDLTFEQLIDRPMPQKRPRIQIDLSGGAAMLHQVELDRDLYYASEMELEKGGAEARGGINRNAVGEIDLRDFIPMRLYDKEYFCIGDNNPLSSDGRYWFPNPPGDPDALWVRQRYFGKALNDTSRDGVVPGELMMGRAFFVYFPAPYAWKTDGYRVIPNFGDMRFIH